jgi:hypothetical protein
MPGISSAVRADAEVEGGESQVISLKLSESVMSSVS